MGTSLKPDFVPENSEWKANIQLHCAETVEIANIFLIGEEKAGNTGFLDFARDGRSKKAWFVYGFRLGDRFCTTRRNAATL